MIRGKGYEINEKNLINHEMIGLKIKVIESSDPSRIGQKGKIIDETKNIFLLENGKILPKKECVFEFIDVGIIKGNEIIKKPEDR